MIKANRHFFFPILATLYNHKLALLENVYLFRIKKMCSRTSFEHLFKKDASFFFYVLGVFWTSKEINEILGCKNVWYLITLYLHQIIMWLIQITSVWKALALNCSNKCFKLNLNTPWRNYEAYSKHISMYYFFCYTLYISLVTLYI